MNPHNPADKDQEIARLTALVRKMREEAQSLVDQLDLIHGHATYQSVWLLWSNHFGKYDGPKYEEELNRLRAALSLTPADMGEWVQKEETKWQLIKTAPTDGTVVLGRLPDSDVPHSVRFTDGRWQIAWDNSYLSKYDQPTHWISLTTL